MFLPLDDPMTWVFTVSVFPLVLILVLLITYLVIRLAITHGMLAYSRQLSEDRYLPTHRDESPWLATLAEHAQSSRRGVMAQGAYRTRGPRMR